MNSLLRKITAGILSATMILTGMGTFPWAMTDLYSYAGKKSGGSSVNTDPNHKLIQSGAMKTSAAGDVDTAKANSYVLEVTTGAQPGDCLKSIVIEYYTDIYQRNKAVNNGVSEYCTQVLTPGKADFGVYYQPNGLGTLVSRFDDGGEYIPFSGSRVATYSNYIYKLTSKGDSYYGLLGGYGSLAYKHLTNFSQYMSKYADALTKVQAQPFASNSVEYIEFKSEYNIYELREISFYCESEGNDSWDLQGWKLYKKIDDSSAGCVSSAYFTDDIRLTYSGYLLASSTEKNRVETTKDALTGKEKRSTICFGFVNAGMLTFGSSALDGVKNREYEYTFNTCSEGSVVRNSENENAARYTFSINIMDEYKAGIESFNAFPGGRALSLSEMLEAVIHYTSGSGCTRELSLPVLSNAILEYVQDGDETSVYSMNSKYNVKFMKEPAPADAYLSYAQQGESIVFSVNFDDIVSLDSIDLHYTNPDANDSLIIEDIRVYSDIGSISRDENNKNYTKGADGVSANVIINENNATLLYATDKTVGGTYLQYADPNKSFKFYSKAALEELEKTKAKDVIGTSNTYEVTINTSNVNYADTTDDVLIAFDYIDLTGKACTTQEYSIKDYSENYYGYNPGLKDGEIVDGTYYYCMRQGGSVSFFIEVANLDHFTNMHMHLVEGATDEWQMSSVQIKRVNSRGHRVAKRIEKGEQDTFGGVQFSRIYTREVPGKVEYSAEYTVLVQKDQTENLDLESGATTGEVERRDYSDYYYKMDYKVASSELHFDEGAWKYEVRVNVQKNSTSATKDDDCGSNNLFYFQLVFEKGTSAYVLANQQLKDDCFRAGEAESFIITVNENMGELISVNIIADDVTEDAQELDKLCIDSIEVIKSNPDTANKRYVCENVGWINVVYSDNEEEIEKGGRTPSEIVTSVPVDRSGYMLSLEVAIGIDSYTDSEKTTAAQFVGSMTADIVYRTSTGERKTLHDVDVVDLMYEYAGRQHKMEEGYGCISDPSFMFRADHINRFKVDISDAQSIESITLNGRPKTECQLPIGGISLKLLTSDGNLIINNSGDFEKIYTKEPILLTDQIPGRTLPHKFPFPIGIYTSYTFNFGENSIPNMGDEEKINSLVSREPQSSNDTLNLFLYMKEGVPTPEIGKYNVVGKIYYSSLATSNTYVNQVSNFKARTENERTVLYAKGLTASNISLLTNLKLSCSEYQTNNIYVDYAIVQQVRSGVVINTYKIDFDSGLVSGALGSTMRTKASATSLGYSQKVSLLLGEGTEKAKLVPEKYDIAVAIKYTSTASGSDTELKSAYVFATDNDVVTIAEGSILEFEFKEPYVKEIVGVEVIAMNGLSVVVDSGNVVCRSTDSAGDPVTNGWFSMDERTLIDHKGEVLKIISTSADDVNSLKRAKFTFTTTAKSGTIDSGGTAPIKMIISYRDVNDMIATAEISDIRSSASGEFTAGEEATVELFLKGAKELIYAEIIPWDDNPTSIASWNLEDITFSLEGVEDSSEHSLPVGRTIYEIEDALTSDTDISNYINMSTMKISLKRVVADEASVSDDTSVQEITVAGGTSVKLTPIITGGLSGYYDCFYDNITGGTPERINKYEKEVGEKVFTFESPESGTQVYSITFVSYENPTIRITIKVNVTPSQIGEKDTPETPVIPPEENSGETNGETGGESGGTDVPESQPADQSTNTGAVTEGTTDSRKRKEEESYDA